MNGILVAVIVAIQLLETVCIPDEQMTVIIARDDVLVQEAPQRLHRDRVGILVLGQLAAANGSLTWGNANVENVQRWCLLHFGTGWEDFN